MTSLNPLRISVLAGDGIGVEVTEAALPVFKALGVEVQLAYGDIGWSCWKKEGDPIPKKTWELIQNTDAILVGAITSKPEKEARIERANCCQNQDKHYISPIIQLRQQLDLFANVRPCFAINEHQFNFCIIRENTEGLYSGFDYYPPPDSISKHIRTYHRWRDVRNYDMSCTLRIQTRIGLKRLFKYAFNYASEHNYSRVSLADKPNVLRQSSAFGREIFEQVALEYPMIKAEILNVDAVAMWLVKRPESFGVIVAENMFGDILSDVGAAVMGGLGFAPSANIGYKKCYFEPVHGSGLMMKQHSANPSAMFLSIGMLLNHYGYKKESLIIVNAIKKVVQNKLYCTYDAGGHATTSTMAKAIIEQCEKRGF